MGFRDLFRRTPCPAAELVEDRDTFPDLDARRARQVLDQVWRERLAIEATWPDEGDYPALLVAFEALERAGIVARMSFTCCQACGHAEIGAEAGPGARGYTFFPEPDAHRLAPGGSELFLAFGAFGSDRQGERDIAVKIAETLTRHGLVVDGDGTVGTRIRLPRLDWRKRLPVG